MKSVVGRTVAPQRCLILIPRPRECVPLCDKRDWAKVKKLRISGLERIWDYPGGADAITRVLINDSRRQDSQGRRADRSGSRHWVSASASFEDGGM